MLENIYFEWSFLMGRLDIFLVEQGLIPTRSRAKRAISYGLVKVNGKIILKPAYSTKRNDQIEILDEIATKPMGYWKLHAITNIFNLKIFTPNDSVLDLGSSAGGFLEFAAKRCKKVVGIEISQKFAPNLHQLEAKYPNISVLIVDVFTQDAKQLPLNEQFDIILNDLTLDPVESMKIFLKFLPLLQKRGHIIMSIKQGKYSSKKCIKFIENSFDRVDLSILRILDIDPDKKELHVIAQKQ